MLCTNFTMVLVLVVAMVTVLPDGGDGSPFLDRLFSGYGLDTSLFETNHRPTNIRNSYARSYGNRRSSNGPGGGRTYKQICNAINPSPYAAPGAPPQGPLCY